MAKQVFSLPSEKSASQPAYLFAPSIWRFSIIISSASLLSSRQLRTKTRSTSERLGHPISQVYVTQNFVELLSCECYLFILLK